MTTLREGVLPAPLLSLALALVWPVLNQSWSLGHVLLGLLLAIVIPWFSEALRDDKPVLRRPLLALRLGGIVLYDIVVSNLQVARLILGREAAIRPGFVWLPLTIADPHGIVALAGIVTTTPGTLSAELSPDRRHLLIHAFNIEGEAALIATIKSRYEAPLMAIFDAAPATAQRETAHRRQGDELGFRDRLAIRRHPYEPIETPGRDE